MQLPTRLLRFLRKLPARRERLQVQAFAEAVCLAAVRATAHRDRMEWRTVRHASTTVVGVLLLLQTAVQRGDAAWGELVPAVRHTGLGQLTTLLAKAGICWMRRGGRRQTFYTSVFVRTVLTLFRTSIRQRAFPLIGANEAKQLGAGTVWAEMRRLAAHHPGEWGFAVPNDVCPAPPQPCAGIHRGRRYP